MCGHYNTLLCGSYYLKFLEKLYKLDRQTVTFTYLFGVVGGAGYVPFLLTLYVFKCDILTFDGEFSSE